MTAVIVFHFRMFRQELANIGFCLGSFIFACPVKFLHGQGIGEMSLVNLIGELEKAVKPDITCGNVRYVTEVIVPITFRYVYNINLPIVFTCTALYVVTFANGMNHLFQAVHASKCCI